MPLLFVSSQAESKNRVMKVIELQLDVCYRHPEENLQRASRWMERCAGADLVVLPEMFTTGFCMEPGGIVEPADGNRAVEWMKRQAARYDCAVAGSIAVEEEGKYYNRFYFVTPDGAEAHYDKRHLFAYGGENLCYTAGVERKVVEFRQTRFLLSVCYDLRFPVWMRNRNDYDVILCVANWPAGRMEVWNALVHARAIENQCYVVAVNRVGMYEDCPYTGGSLIVDAWGRTVATAEQPVETMVEAELNLTRQAVFRKKFPVLNDADAFTLDGGERG